MLHPLPVCCDLSWISEHVRREVVLLVIGLTTAPHTDLRVVRVVFRRPGIVPVDLFPGPWREHLRLLAIQHYVLLIWIAHVLAEGALLRRADLYSDDIVDQKAGERLPRRRCIVLRLRLLWRWLLLI